MAQFIRSIARWGFVFVCAGLIAGCGEAGPVSQNTTQAQTPSPAAATPAEASPEDTSIRLAQRNDDGPYARRIKAPELPADMEWLNTAGPLSLRDLRGKFVLLDFWTYCCINCIHILPELKQLEEEFDKELVVIGVHSAKFETEKEAKNIEEAILRYNIRHPVVNDDQHKIWNMFGVRSWPTLLLIDPEGHAVQMWQGETTYEQIAPEIEKGVRYYRRKGVLDDTPLRFELAEYKQEKTPLRYPGKVLADEASNRLYIADSNHNRIVVAALDGELLEIIGSGVAGSRNGGYAEAQFNQPQGMALHGDSLYVADTENHLIRKVNLKSKRVSTVAGTGEQGLGFPGLEDYRAGERLPRRWLGAPRRTALNSPWALLVHDETLYIAMAGPHQIWRMPLDESNVGPYAGNGREDIVDGPLLPRVPYQMGYSSFAQPSGLASDGEWLYVADSEGSSVRAVPFDPEKEVRTVVGTDDQPSGRLFIFGDVDGPAEQVKLQHVLGVVYHEGVLYIADTYNNKIKSIDAESGFTRTVAGSAEPGKQDDPGQFDEPAGVSFAAGKIYVADTNNHLIRTVDPESGDVATLEIRGLQPPQPPEEEKAADFADAEQERVRVQRVNPENGELTLKVKLELPEGWKINPLAPMAYTLQAVGEQGPVQRELLGRKSLDEPTAEFTAVVPVQGEGDDSLQLGMNYFYCQEEGSGLCKIGSVRWTVPLNVTASADDAVIELSHEVRP